MSSYCFSTGWQVRDNKRIWISQGGKLNSLRAADLYIDPNAGNSVHDGHIYRS